MRVRRRALVATIASLSLVSTGLPVVAAPANAAAAPEWLERLNSYRVSAGVAPVTENAEWTAGIAAHLRYLKLTPTIYRTGAYENAHTENPDSPYYTAEGDKAGRSSNLLWGASVNSTTAIDSWMAAPFHAIGMLRGQLTESAFAQQDTAAGLDVIQGVDGKIPRPIEPVLFPGPASSTSLSRYSQGEMPNPLETCRYTSAGLPLIAMLPSPAETGIQATLRNPEGETASIGKGLCVVTADNYVSSDPVYGPTGLSILKRHNAVLIIPLAPLHRGTYTVTITQPTRDDITWSFTSTAPPLRPPQQAPKPADPESLMVTVKTPKQAKIKVNVNPDLSGKKSWKVQVLKKKKGTFVKVRTVRTKGPQEIVKVDVPRGSYKIRVPTQHGHAAVTSKAVRVRR